MQFNHQYTGPQIFPFKSAENHTPQTMAKRQKQHSHIFATAFFLSLREIVSSNLTTTA